MNPKRFFAELKRRNVYRAAVLYGMRAWLIAPDDIGTRLSPLTVALKLLKVSSPKLKLVRLSIMGETRGLSRPIKR
jgi:hypothetical protein